jgi:heptosyltransferase-1
MADPRFLLVRLSSMGDVIHTLPAASALRDTFSGARIDWAVDPQWTRLLEGNPDLSEVISVDRRSAAGIVAGVRRLRAAQYDCAIDFQSLYKSALLALASGASRRVGFERGYAREGLASLFYSERVNPRGAHKVEHNLALVEAVGARKSKPRFVFTVRPEDDERVVQELAEHGLGELFVLNPGGGWSSKCWPAERYGELHRRLAGRYSWRGVVTFGPGEEGLARQVLDAAGDPPPAAIALTLGPLMALMRRARFVVSADTGPLHLAAALGAPVVGLFGPTDPSRNGPYSTEPARTIVVRNPRSCETTYRRGDSYSPGMLSITVEQVFRSVERLLERRA